MRALLAAALALAVLAGDVRAQSTITFSGSSTVVPLVADLAYYYRRSVERPPRFALSGGISATGIADALRGISSAGLVARDREPQDPPSLVFTPIALSAICIVTHPSNPLGNLSRAQVQDLVAGRVADWSQVPGATLTGPVATVGWSPGTAARTVFLSTFVDLPTPVTEPQRAFTTSRAVRSAVQATASSWSYVDLAFARDLHRVAYEGVACDAPTIASGAYPARRTLNVVTRGRPNRTLARFLGWIRADRIARRVVATRYVPVDRGGG